MTAPTLPVTGEHGPQLGRHPVWSLPVTAVERLLRDLRESLGLCLPPGGQARLRERPPPTVAFFTDEVLLAERLDPGLADRKLKRAVRERVARAFMDYE